MKSNGLRECLPALRAFLRLFPGELERVAHLADAVTTGHDVLAKHAYFKDCPQIFLDNVTESAKALAVTTQVRSASRTSRTR